MHEKPNNNGILARLKAGEPIRLNDPEYDTIHQIVNNTIRLSQQMNTSGDTDAMRRILSEIIGQEVDESTLIFPPFHTNFGRFTQLGKNVFINHACSFLDMGGITVEDGVLIGPRVNIVTESHPLESEDRKALIGRPVVIKSGAWIGAGATILPGVTVGANAVVAAGAVVAKDVDANTIVGGVPARFIKNI